MFWLKICLRVCRQKCTSLKAWIQSNSFGHVWGNWVFWWLPVNIELTVTSIYTCPIRSKNQLRVKIPFLFSLWTMLDLYTVNSVCLIVPEGGYIFECYLYGHSPYQINKNFLGYLRQANEEFRPSILPWQNEELLEQSHNHFMGYILYSLSAVGSNGNKQYFYHTLCCNFHGLSRQG